MTVDPTDEDVRTDEDLVRRLTRWYKEAVSAGEKSTQVAEKAAEFYRGQQWSDEDLAILEDEGRPALTINRIMPNTNLLCGIERKNRKDVKVYPRRRGTAAVAKVLTAVCKHAMDESLAEWEKSESFKDGVIRRRGWLRLRVEPGEFDELDVSISRVSPGDVLEDPLARTYDLNRSARFIIVRDWMTREEIELQWPNTVEKAGGAGSFWQNMVRTGAHVIGYLTGRQEGDDFKGLRRKYQKPVLEVWYRKPMRVVWLTETQTGQRKRLIDPEDIVRAQRTAEEHPEVFDVSVPLVAKVLHVARILGDVLLEKEQDPFRGVDLFPVVRYAPFFDDGECMGLVEHLMSPQEEKNKRRSQALHNLNQSANSGWLYEDGALTPDEEAKLEQWGSSPGIMVKYHDGKKPEQITPEALSQGHIQLSEMADRDINQISGVNRELLGQEPKAGMSGRALSLQQRQGLMTTEMMFDNWDCATQILARTLVELIRHMDIYSPDEIAALVDKEQLVDRELLKEAAKRLAELGTKPPQVPPPPDENVLGALDPLDAARTLTSYRDAVELTRRRAEFYDTQVRQAAEALLFSELESMKVGRYGVKVMDSANSPTTRAANFQELSEIARLYPGVVPPDVFVEASDIANKERLLERLEQQTAPAQPGPRPAGRGVDRDGP